LSGRRLDEIRAALESSDATVTRVDPIPNLTLSPIKRYLAWRRTSVGAPPTHGPREIAVLTTPEMVFAAATNGSILVIFLAELLLWFRFSEYLPSRASTFMVRDIQPHGPAAVLSTLAVVAIVGGVVVGARHYQFTVIRDGDSLRTVRGLLGKQTATIPADRVQAVRIVEGLWRAPFGYCRLEVELAGVGVATADQRLLFPCVRVDRVEAFVRQALPELPSPGRPSKVLPARARRRYLTLPLGYAAGLALLMLFLPGWWALLAAVPLPVGCLLGVARAREARWLVDDRCVVLRWRSFVNRHTVIAHRAGAQYVELSTSRRKAKAGVAGFSMRFSPWRTAKIRYMVDSDALFLLHVIGRDSGEADSVRSL
jgi:putative membrane protein